ncbi:TIGR03016 family PEP-CTERM system-associated outer membrane protein [Brumicola blandensis]|uniref:TIGR03016 family PEP-CTERM system-associated outer membrane protein n=1 Tax=Brumicola blandensis TaxID=3075611 RepID=A0AAW8QZM4_9ALTE|nr:TIGR03016 family PEP-CTERM system-associated outer membrane protein [Alteromonas sp. W409]MDT0582618.1 TIGR03016 family PEP-CTERM system-associated outer membrane protein [Alteromonas sp. W409]
MTYYSRKKTCIAKAIIAIVLGAGYSSISFANELKYTIGVDSEAIFQDVFSEELQERINSTNYIVKPRLSVNYETRRGNFNWTATHSHVRRDLDELSTTDNYTNYSYRAGVELIDNLLNFNASGALNYQTVSSGGFLVDNFLLNANNLSKTRSNRFGLNLDLPKGDYFGHRTQVNYSSTESEQREGAPGQLNSNVISINTSTFTGENFERLSAQLNTSFAITDREEQGDYTNRLADVALSYRVKGNIGVIVTGTHEANQVASESEAFSLLRDFNSIGAGIIWRESDNKAIALTWNRADNESVEVDEDNNGYIGVDINWAFNPRTQVSADYSRRFFGESGSFSFQHRIKRFRTQIQYTEEVTSFSQLIADPNNLGVFVCADGINDLASCFQPSSLNYQLAPNETFVQFSDQNSEINDELILRKGLSWQVGTQQRRTSVSLSGRYSTNEYLESDRLSRTYSASTSVSFNIGQKTNIRWTTDAAFTDDILEGDSGSSDVYSSELSLTRKLGRYFDLSLDFSYLDRTTEGRVVGGTATGLTGDLQDRRISLNLKYTLNK